MLPTIPSVPAIPGVPAVPALPTANSLKSKLPKLPTHPQAIYKLIVDEQDITQDISGRLSSLTLTDNRGFEADQLEIVLDDSDGKLALPARGALMKLGLGWKETGLIDKGSYTVDEVAHDGAPDIITIHARSAELSSGLTTQRERSFHQKALGDIVRTIAAENELQVIISSQLDTLTIAHIDQTNESSAAFLTRMAGMFDAVATVKNDKLIFIHAGAGVSASGTALPSVTITRQSGDRHHFSIADRGSYTHVKALWYDIGLGTRGEVIWDEKMTSDESSRAAKVVAAPVGNYKTLPGNFKSRQAAQREARKAWKVIAKSKAQAAQYIGVKAAYKDLNLKVNGEVSYGAADDLHALQNASALAKKDAAKNAPPQNAFEASADNIKTMRHTYANKESAYRAARAEWRRIKRGMATFSIDLALGRPELFPEIPATVEGFKREIDNTDWIITKATHTLMDKGLATKLEFEIKATEIPG